MWLTDSQQIKLLQELSDTSAKLERVFKKYHLDTVPQDVIDLRNEIARQKQKESKIDGWKFLRNIAAKVVGDIDDLSKR